MKKAERVRQLQIRKRLALLGLLSIGALSGVTYLGVKHDNNHFSFEEIEREIDIHSGIYETPDGDRVSPFLDHDCEVPNDGRDFEERLSERMLEDGYDTKTVDAAVQRFEFQCKKEFDLAREINLKQIEKEAKEAKMMARGR